MSRRLPNSSAVIGPLSFSSRVMLRRVSLLSFNLPHLHVRFVRPIIADSIGSYILISIYVINRVLADIIPKNLHDVEAQP